MYLAATQAVRPEKGQPIWVLQLKDIKGVFKSILPPKLFCILVYMTPFFIMEFISELHCAIMSYILLV